MNSEKPLPGNIHQCGKAPLVRSLSLWGDRRLSPKFGGRIPVRRALDAGF
jgi:hypothetical protein